MWIGVASAYPFADKTTVTPLVTADDDALLEPMGQQYWYCYTAEAARGARRMKRLLLMVVAAIFSLSIDAWRAFFFFYPLSRKK
jgi:hypothetical protein